MVRNACNLFNIWSLSKHSLISVMTQWRLTWLTGRCNFVVGDACNMFDISLQGRKMGTFDAVSSSMCTYCNTPQHAATCYNTLQYAATCTTTLQHARTHFAYATRLICICDVTHSYLQHGSFHLYLRHDSSVCAKWPICICDMTHSYLRHDSYVVAIWLIHICNVTHLYLGYGSFVSATWLICICDMAHLYLRHDAFVSATWRIRICDMTHS